MIPGVGFSELMVIFVLVLLFFGSKEIPQLMREAGKLYRKAKTYTDAVKNEFDQLTREIDPTPPFNHEVIEKKKMLRTKFIGARKALAEEDRQAKSAQIVEHLLADHTAQKALAIMVYASLPHEVSTRDLIAKLMAAGKRIVLPFCRSSARNLGIASITDFAKDTAPGEYGITEPVEALRDNFFKSDLQLILCPGLGFDVFGARLGRGMGFYDNFLRELKGKIPVWGIAFDCQISQERFPFEYTDVGMDQVVTESGLLIKAPETEEERMKFLRDSRGFNG
jgi:5-formyltetrahydrofolate cyclo-ligase